jgi:hypothetical protein
MEHQSLLVQLSAIIMPLVALGAGVLGNRLRLANKRLLAALAELETKQLPAPKPKRKKRRKPKPKPDGTPGTTP